MQGKGKNEKDTVLGEKWEVLGGYGRKSGFWWENEVFVGLWTKIEVSVENVSFFENWGFCGFLVKKSGKNREK